MANDAMVLRCEVGEAPEGLAARIVDTVRDVTKLRGEVEARRAGQPAQRRQGDRGRPQVRLNRGERVKDQSGAAIRPSRTIVVPGFRCAIDGITRTVSS